MTSAQQHNMVWKKKAFPKVGVLTKIKNSAAVGTQSQGGWKKSRPHELPELMEIIQCPPLSLTCVMDINQFELHIKGYTKPRKLKNLDNK